MKEQLPSHIPHGAIEKSNYAYSLNTLFEEFGCRFFAFDGKCYSYNPESEYNGMNWDEFCKEIDPNKNIKK